MILGRGIPWKILAGEATQVRRVVDERAPGYRLRRGRRGQSHQQVRPFRPRIGAELPLQRLVRQDGRDVPETVGHAMIVAWRVERHGDISFLDVRASGHRTTADYKRGWVLMHDRAWVREQGEDLLDVDDFVARFDAAHADRQVYVLELEPVRQRRGRFLAADPGAAQADYVATPARAMRGEPEAVDERYLADLVKRNAAKPRMTQRQVWEESRAEIVDAIERLKEAELGRDVFSSIRALERQLERLDRKIAA